MFWFESTWLDHCSIDSRSIECNFRLIELVFRSIENRSKSFLKQEFFMCSSLFNFSKRLYSLPLRPVQIQKQVFLSFSLNFSQGFLSSSIGKTIMPFLFQFLFIFHAFEGEFLDFIKFGVSDFLANFFHN